jgi:hypothetical protein
VPAVRDAWRRVEREDLRIGKPAKRARLRGPVEIAERPGEALEMMFRPVVIAIDCREQLKEIL